MISFVLFARTVLSEIKSNKMESGKFSDQIYSKKLQV